MRGDLITCLYDYPPLLYAIIVYIVFMARCFLYIHFGVKKSPDGSVVKYMYILIALMLIQWVIKIVAQVCFDYYWFL